MALRPYGNMTFAVIVRRCTHGRRSSSRKPSSVAPLCTALLHLRSGGIGLRAGEALHLRQEDAAPCRAVQEAGLRIPSLRAIEAPLTAQQALPGARRFVVPTPGVGSVITCRG